MPQHIPEQIVTASAVATMPSSGEVSARLCVRMEAAGLGQGRADLAVLFCSAHYATRLETIADNIMQTLSPGCLVGMSAEAVIQGDIEYENRAGVALWAARLPGAHVRSFHFSQQDIERLETPEAIHDHLAIAPDVHPAFLLLGDPLTINVPVVLERLETAYPERPAIGGMASSGSEPGENVLLFDGQALHHGLSGVALWGDVQIDTLVSQGCRPIGKHTVITQAERNIIRRLGGRPALQVVSDLFESCSDADRELLQHNGLFLGRVINEYQRTFARGDFLIRNTIGFDRDSGAMAVNDYVRTGQTVQFHVRDAAAADEDLESLLSAAHIGGARGALLFCCNSRGTRLFETPNHDAAAVARHTGGVPLAGAFCAGEIGPIGRQNYIHGHAASIAFFSSLVARDDV